MEVLSSQGPKAVTKRGGGGGNPQLGPRFIDTKKAARGKGPLLKVLDGVGLANQNAVKENVNPNKETGGEPSGPNTLTGPTLVGTEGSKDGLEETSSIVAVKDINLVAHSRYVKHFIDQILFWGSFMMRGKLKAKPCWPR